jgi:hypothetical protein
MSFKHIFHRLIDNMVITNDASISEEIISYLEKEGNSEVVNSRTPNFPGDTPLHRLFRYVWWNKSIESFQTIVNIINYLFKNYNVDINLKNYDGQTPIELAVNIIQTYRHPLIEMDINIIEVWDNIESLITLVNKYDSRKNEINNIKIATLLLDNHFCEHTFDWRGTNIEYIFDFIELYIEL